MVWIIAAILTAVGIMTIAPDLLIFVFSKRHRMVYEEVYAIEPDIEEVPPPDCPDVDFESPNACRLDRINILIQLVRDCEGIGAKAAAARLKSALSALASEDTIKIAEE